jgi:hypothetical protein
MQVGAGVSSGRELYGTVLGVNPPSGELKQDGAGRSSRRSQIYGELTNGGFFSQNFLPYLSAIRCVLGAIRS